VAIGRPEHAHFQHLQHGFSVAAQLAGANPFSGTFTLDTTALQALSQRAGDGPLNLTLQYRGKVDVTMSEAAAAPETRSMAFTRALASDMLTIVHPNETSLSFTYANWICAPDSGTADQCLTSLAVESLSQQTAVFNVSYATRDGNLAPITDRAIEPPAADPLFALANALQGGLVVAWVLLALAASPTRCFRRELLP
jgi:hypothetical protein